MRRWKLWVLPLWLLAAGCASSPDLPQEAPPPPVAFTQPAPVPQPPQRAEAPPAAEALAAAQPGAPAERELAAVLSAMSLERRIAQRFACWVSGTEAGGRNEKLVREVGLGGVILNTANVRSPQQVAALVRSLQAAAAASSPAIGLFVGVDQEGGRVTRLRFEGMSRFPPPFYWAAHQDERFVASAAYITNVEIREMGVNMNFAPVLDVYPTPDESVIGDRSFGGDPQAVGRLGVQYIEAASRAGVVAVPKHFPGHGESDGDSHRTLPVADAPRAQLEARALPPFRAVIAAGAEAIMTAHVLYRELDPELPATLSRKIVRGLLRDELGFRGVVVSDAIEMAALDRGFPLESILRYAIQAGVDLILVGGRHEPTDLVAAVKRLVERGEISGQEIDEGVLRILRLKQKRGLLAPQAPRPAPSTAGR